MSSARKWLIVLLVVGASLSVVLAAMWVSQGQGPAQDGSGQSLRGTPPNVSFAAGVTSGDKQVDEFVGHFLGLCRRGDYEQYRLCWTAYGIPVSGERFAKMWKSVRKIVITQIVPAPPGVKARDRAYIIRGVAELDPKDHVPAKDVEIMVQWEDNRWAVAPAPKLDDQPAGNGTFSVTDTAPASRPSGTQHG